MSIDFLELDEDLEFDEVKRKVEDGINDDWLTVPVRAIAKYSDYRILEELEDIERIVHSKVRESELDQATKDRIYHLFDLVLNNRVLRLVETLKRKDPQD